MKNSWAKTVLDRSPQPAGLILTHRHPVRRWHGDSFVDLARRLQKRGAPVWWFWGPGEEAYVLGLAAQVPGSRVTPSTTLRQMAALLSCCRYVANKR